RQQQRSEAAVRVVRERALEVGRGVLDDDRGAGDRRAARVAHGSFDDARGGLRLCDGEGRDDEQCEPQKAPKKGGTHHRQKPPCSIRTGAYACGRAREIECNVYLGGAGHIKRISGLLQWDEGTSRHWRRAGFLRRTPNPCYTFRSGNGRWTRVG